MKLLLSRLRSAVTVHKLLFNTHPTNTSVKVKKLKDDDTDASDATLIVIGAEG